MIKLPKPAGKRQAESTISLINVVFLMLIFFLIAGQLSPPVDPKVDLIRTQQAPALPPPDALFIDVQGTLRHRGQETTAETYLDRLRREHDLDLIDSFDGEVEPEAGVGTTGDGAEVEDGGKAPLPLASSAPRIGPPVMLAADKELAAARLLEAVDALYAAGAAKVSLVTTNDEGGGVAAMEPSEAGSAMPAPASAMSLEPNRAPQ